jgi:ketosteroid isomerase-like protein
MKSSILFILLAMVSMPISQTQPTDMEAIQLTITAFAKAADQNDAKTLAQYLDPNYRIVMNQLFGSSEVNIMPRAVYLDKIAKKEFGGDDRSLKFENISINGSSASAIVLLKGKKMTFRSIFTLVKNAEGKWKLVSDVPEVI